MVLLYIISDFKSGAREVILGEDTDMIGEELKYPVKGRYGIIISFEEYKKYLLNLLKILYK